MASRRRTYTPEFKTETVKLVTEQGYSVAEAARSLGLSENLLRSWKHALASKGTDAFPGQGKLPAVEDELRRLRAENKRLVAERDILKKATAFFAREALGPSTSARNTESNGPCACSAKRSRSPPPATTPGGAAPPAPKSNAATPSSWKSGRSTRSSRPVTAARASMPNWSPAANPAA